MTPELCFIHVCVTCWLTTDITVRDDPVQQATPDTEPGMYLVYTVSYYS